MLKQLNFRNVSGNIPENEMKLIDSLIASFEELLEERSRNIPPKVIRSKIPGSVYIIQDPEKIILAYAPRSGNEVRYINENKNVLPTHVIRDLSMQLDIDDCALAVLPRYVMELTGDARKIALVPAVDDHIRRGVESFQMNTGISAFSPIFGPNKYPVQDNLVFVLMPFESKLTQIYESIVKEAIQDDCGLACRRADDIKSINPIIQDIWKSICEARIVLADLTGFNPNVMYELGIAHTLGKPTLIIYQDAATEHKFPFDLAHIRRINYSDNAIGGKQLRSEVATTLRTMIQFES